MSLPETTGAGQQMMMQLGLGSGLAATAILLTLACDGGDDGAPTGNSGSFTITSSPTSASVQRGALTPVTITLTRSGGFSDAVTLTASGMPTGVSATMDPGVLSASAVSSRIDLTASAVAALGTSTVTITGTSGSKQSSTTLALTVAEASAYTISVAPVALSINAGGSGTADVTIVRTNFTAGIVFALVNPPTGVTGSFSHSPALGGATILSLSVAPNVTPGVHTLAIRGTTPGLADRTAELALTVLPAPSNAVVEYLYCDAGQAPTWFAFQDGTGAWQPVTPTTSGGAVRFAFTLTSGRGGVLTLSQAAQDGFRRQNGSVQRAPASRRPGISMRARFTEAPGAPAVRVAAAVDVYQTDVWYATTTELASDGRANCAATLPVKTIRGTVAGVAPGQYGRVSLGSATDIYNGGVPNNPLVFEGVRDGPVDLVASRVVTPGLAPDRGLVLRNLNIADGGSLPSIIDFNGAGVFTPATATVTVTGSDGDRLESYAGLITATSDLLFWSDLAPSQATVRPWAGLDLESQRAGDFPYVLVFASAANSPGDFRASLRYVSSVSNQSLSLGPVVGLPTISSIAAGSYPRFRFQGSLPSEYSKGVGMSVVPEDVGNVYSIYASAGWLAASGGPAAYDLIMPDVAGLAGFPATARLTAGVHALMIDAFGFSGAGVLNVVPAIGSEFKASVRTMPLVVPE